MESVKAASGGHDELASRRASRRGALACMALGFTYCYATSLPVVASTWFSERFVTPGPATPGDDETRLSRAPWNAESYIRIAAEGYQYDPRRPSSVAFFPAYPLLGAGASKITSLPVTVTMPLVSHLALLGSFTLLAAYTAARWPDAPAEGVHWVLLACGLFPTTFHWRMPYSEPTFLLLALTAMYGMARGWPLPLIAAVVGAATAARPVGVALLAPFGLHIWSSFGHGGAGAPVAGIGRALLKSVYAAGLIVIACWGLAGFMAWQCWHFGEPLAFVKTQALWARLPTNPSLADHVWRLVTLAPLRAVYDSSTPCHWKSLGPPTAVFNMMFANPIYFLLAATAVAYGARRKWLDGKECLLAAMLLLIPYVVHADRTCMLSHGRFASVAFPTYLVFGRVLSRLPQPLAALICATSATLLVMNAALFASWYWS